MPFRLVYTEFWQDPKVMEEMTPEDKYFYLYLLTNPNTNMIGVYRIVRKQIAFDLGYSIESVNSLMERFINFHKLIKYNNETKEICIIHYGKYNLNRGGKPMLDCIKKDLSNVKDIDLVKDMLMNVKNVSIKTFIEEYLSNINNDTCHDTYNDTVTTSEREADKTNNHNPISNNHNPISNIQTTTTTSNSSYISKGNLEVFKHFEKCGFIITSILMEQIAADIEVYSKEWLMDAAKEAMNRGKINNYKYVLGILQNWQSKGRNDTNVIRGSSGKSDKPGEIKYDYSQFTGADEEWDGRDIETEY